MVPEGPQVLRKGSRGLPRAPLEVPMRRPRVSQDDPRRASVGFSRPPRGSKRLSRLSLAILDGFRSAFTKFSLYNRLHIDLDEIWTRLGLNCTAYVLDD